MDPKRFVSSLVIPDKPLALFKREQLAVLQGRQVSDDTKAAVDKGSLVSFTEKLSGQNKDDVLNSTLLAQLAADHQYDRNKDTMKWYQFYQKVLSNIGWVMQSMDFTNYKSKQQSFELSAAVVEMLLSLVGDEEPALLDIAKKTLDALKSDSGGLKLFDRSSHSPDAGNFQILPCTVDKSGQITAAFLGAYFKASSVENNYLFFTYKNADIELHKATQVVTLNEDVYSQVREEIIKKLGQNASDFIHNLRL